MRLRRRILLATVVAVIPLVLVAGWVAYRAAHAALDAELGRRLASVAGLLADQFSASGDAGRLARLEPDSQRIRARFVDRLTVARDATGMRRIRIVDPALQTLADTEPHEPFAQAWELEADQLELTAVLAREGAQASLLFEAPDGAPVKRGWAAVFLDGQPVAIVVVEANADYFLLLTRYRNAMALLALVVIGLIALVSNSLARRVTLPLTELERAAARLGAGDLSQPIVVDDSGEIGALAHTLESARTRLAQRDEDTQLMLAGIAHEVRNPLGGIELYAGLLHEELDHDPRQSHVLRIRRELGHLNAVVGSFLAFARERPIELNRVSTRELLEPVLACVAELAQSRSTLVVLDVATGAEELTVDPEQTRAAVQNVVQNAIQACSASDRVTITATVLDRGVAIRVEDSGEGMSPEQLRSVFRPFYTTREKGTGLGLPLVRKTVERHGGTLEVRSEPGVGTTITMTFPLVPGIESRVSSGGNRSSDADSYEMIG